MRHMRSSDLQPHLPLELGLGLGLVFGLEEPEGLLEPPLGRGRGLGRAPPEGFLPGAASSSSVPVEGAFASVVGREVAVGTAVAAGTGVVGTGTAVAAG